MTLRGQSHIHESNSYTRVGSRPLVEAIEVTGRGEEERVLRVYEEPMSFCFMSMSPRIILNVDLALKRSIKRWREQELLHLLNHPRGKACVNGTLTSECLREDNNSWDGTCPSGYLSSSSFIAR